MLTMIYRNYYVITITTHVPMCICIYAHTIIMHVTYVIVELRCSSDFLTTNPYSLLSTWKSWELCLFFVLFVSSSFLVLVLCSHPCVITNFRKYLVSVQNKFWSYRQLHFHSARLSSYLLLYNLCMYKVFIHWNSNQMHDLQKICWVRFYKTSLLEHEKVFFFGLLFVLYLML